MVLIFVLMKQQISKVPLNTLTLPFLKGMPSSTDVLSKIH